MFVAFRPGRNRPNIGGPNVRGFSTWSESPEHWGQIGRNRPNIGVRLLEIARTLGVPMFVAFRPDQIGRTLGSDWSESPEHWGQIGRNRPKIGVRLLEIARTLGAPMFVAFRPGRNRPNIGVRLVGIARTLGSDWAKSPEHWGADGSKSPEGLNK